jgi:hypothetical protein
MITQSLLDGVKVSSNLPVENLVPNKLIGRLNNPCLAIPLRDPGVSAGCDLEISELAGISRKWYAVDRRVQDSIPEIGLRQVQGTQVSRGQELCNKSSRKLDVPYHRPHSDSC